MRKGSVVVGRFGAPQPLYVTRYAADTVTVRHADNAGRPYGDSMELPTFAIANPDTEQRFSIVRCNEQVNDEGEVTQRWWKAYHHAYGLAAVRMLADLHVPEHDRWNWYYQPVNDDDTAGELIELQSLYERMPEEA